jgi:putative transposase
MNPIIKKRKSIRLKEYDYSQPGAYFITICTKDREHLFGEVRDAQMIENEYGKAVQACWNALPEHYPNVQLDAFRVMPSHMHGIVMIIPDDNEPMVGAIHESPLPKTIAERRRMLLSKIMGRFKMNSAKQINLIKQTPGQSVWQRNYFEHIIRDEKSLNRIRQYIITNPERWQFDQENKDQIAGDEFDSWLLSLKRSPIAKGKN